ncbi:rpoC2 [Symbiodinium natans]|uniref:RpoC2 protein n=1 Tax=Symbiodinium natans TaxID=878477 RepID=A0A812IBX1_9DINO|nr:rpoC2 [Symbiodinium natans]
MGDCLATEPLAVPRTSDIVQGLPRIDRLFEAANKQLEARLDRIFEEEARRRSSLDAAYAARQRFEQELLADIQSAYGEQGVNISSKHIEVVVRRMTEKCIIEEGISGLPPGTLMNYVELEGLCALQPSGEVRVRPTVRGLTAIGRDGSHVLVAMGFREVDNVVASAIFTGAGRYGFEGVKENLMIGKAVSVGSKTASSATSADCEIDFDRIPDWAEKDAVSAGSLAKRIDGMKAQMEAGREATRRQLDALQQQQESLEKISSPEDFVNFMTKEGGVSQEDLQRMLTGDPKHMEDLVAKMLNKAADPGESAVALAGAEEAIKSAEELHTRDSCMVVCGRVFPLLVATGRPLLLGG